MFVLQAARKVDSANQKVIKEAKEEHENRLEKLRAANEIKIAEARKEWEKECQVARAHHERLAAVFCQEFEIEKEGKSRANSVLLEKQRGKWQEAVCAALLICLYNSYDPCCCCYLRPGHESI